MRTGPHKVLGDRLTLFHLRGGEGTDYARHIGLTPPSFERSWRPFSFYYRTLVSEGAEDAGLGIKIVTRVFIKKDKVLAIENH